MWHVGDDVFYYVDKRRDIDHPVTKRSILSHVSSLYDPLGLVCPVIMQGRLLFQEAVRLKLGWDTEIPAALSDKWSEWLLSLKALENIKFLRCIIPSEFDQGAKELHYFCDASMAGYGACCYLRITNHDGRIFTALVTAKARLAPIKSLSIPRLELCTAVVAVKMDCVVRRELDIDLLPSTFWSDSSIVLSYINSDTKRFKIFVGNRITLIRENTVPEQWKHVPGTRNPADVLSRGCTAHALPSEWHTGPIFLSQHKDSWPSRVFTADEISTNDPEIRQNVTECNVTCATPVDNIGVRDVHDMMHPVDQLIKHYSSWYRLKKALCWLLRVIKHLRGEQITGGSWQISVPEMKHAECVIIKHVQTVHFDSEIDSISRGKPVAKSSALRDLNPMLDSGILVVGGRLKHSRAPLRLRHPIILPSKHKLSDLILSEYHGDAHLGTEWTLSRVQSQFWIPRARNKLKKIKRDCVTCKKLYAGPMQQKMADLLPERCVPDKPPFTYTGLDLFGPFLVRSRRSEVKRYGVIFTCFNTRGVHLEVVHNLETDSFINAFLRFIARRGCPCEIWSDNGTNIVGARTEMIKSMKSLDRDSIVRAARRKNVEWHFNPPHGSHHGGVWERLIRSIRRVILSVLGLSPRLTDEILLTAFCEIENLINSRPLTKCTEDIHDDAPLTPNHLLLLCNDAAVPLGVFQETDMYRRRWRHVWYLTTLFWKRWVKEYLPLLQRRRKWQNDCPNVKLHDLVLIIDENSPRGMWPLGKVVDVVKGRDGLLRSARLRTQTTQVVRPITKLVHLEGVN